MLPINSAAGAGNRAGFIFAKMQDYLKAMKIPLAVTLLLACAAPCLAGERQYMSGAELTSVFPGMTMVGNYGDGVKFAETYHLGGNITYRDDQESDTGHWFERNGLFCTFYQHGDGACYAVTQTGANCYEMYVRENEDGSKSKFSDNWNSVGWDNRRPSTCDLEDKTV